MRMESRAIGVPLLTMIDITVRTLDSQNHNFSVEDDFTVLQFKQHIESSVEIPANTQRIIYCGRVLADESKLVDLDVHGKVVHLVERPPPSDNPIDGSNSVHSPQMQQLPQQQRVLGGNAMYLGSMAIPFEPQNLVPPPPTFRLAASRLAVARRMLRRAEAAIALLENPTVRPVPTGQGEEVQIEVTPVFEARVIVPASSGENLNETIINAVQSSLLSNAANLPANPPTTTTQPSETATTETPAEPETTTASVQSGGSTPTSSTEDLAGETRPSGSGSTNQGSNTSQENISRTSEMAELLETLVRLQQRFAPFLEQYQTFMREDPIMSPEPARSTDRTFNRISEVLHLFGHAYHSLSDIILRVRSAPPRRLACLPILIQQTAVLPAGFPIQVEAQINFATDAPNQTTPSTATSTSNGTQTHSTSTDASRPSSATNTGSNSNIPGQGGANPSGNANANRTSRVTIPQFEFMNIPGLPQGAVHVQSIPIGIRTMRSGTGNRPASAGSGPNANPESNAQGNNQLFGNPNVELFMEVTPESITIDSLETALLGVNQSEGARSVGAAPPPEFIQSIMQMAGQLVNRGASTSNVTASQAPTEAASTTTTTAPQQNNGNPGQNSQARGNTQTNPTTATHTRSTARPHVQFAQHAIQGFDPFLPCNSHHIMHLRGRGGRGSGNNNQMNNNNVRPQNGNMPPGGGNQFNPVYNLVQGVLNSLQNIYGRRNGGPPQPSQGGPQAASTTASATTTGAAPPSTQSPSSDQSAPPLLYPQILGNMPNFLMSHLVNSNSNDRGPTIAQLLQQAGDQTEGEGIFNDILMLLSRNITIGDLLQLNSGRLDPLLRIRNEIRTFVSERILEGNPATLTNVERAVNKLLGEMQSFLDILSHLPAQEDIDLVRSTQMLFRTRLPNVINVAVSRRPVAIKSMVDQLKLICRHLCALIMHATGNGQRGVEDVINRIVVSYMDGISPDIQQWTQAATRAQLQEFIHSVNVPFSALQPYIVRRVDSVTASLSETAQNAEPMDVDVDGEQANEVEYNAGASNVLGEIDLEESEDMPANDIGSESWHGQVPADWVPIIARDTQRQRRSNQVPLSDGYLSGMPSKRRKVVTNNKPQGTLPQVITESIRRAVTTTGLSSVGNVETVAQEAGADLTIQSAYRDLLRTSVQASIQDNEDFTPERFPNASTYFSKPQ